MLHALALTLSMLLFVASPGQEADIGFLCKTPEAAMRFGIAVDRNETPIEVGTALLRSGECAAFIFRPPHIEFVEAVDAQERTQVWRVRWGEEDWYVPVDIPKVRDS